MLAILLLALGIPLWLVLGALGAGVSSRRSFRRTPGVFAVKVRGADVESNRWPRRTGYARWVHDVLIVHQGLALVRSRALPAASASELPLISSVGGLGDDPVVIRLGLDDGTSVDVATSRTDRDELIGPIRDRLVERSA